MKDRIYITETDLARLRNFLESRVPASAEERANLLKLEEELDRAEVVAATRMRPDVITMHSEVRLQDLDTREVRQYRLVFPGERHPGVDCVSVLAPIGTALLGYRRGDTITWMVPRGIRRLKILDIVQPSDAYAVAQRRTA